MGPPTIRGDTHSCAVLPGARVRGQPAHPRVRAMTVKGSLELKELQLQIRGRPEQRPVNTFAAYRPDQALDEGMRQRHVRRRLDGFNVEDPQIRLPLAEAVPAGHGPNRGRSALVGDPSHD